MVGLTARFSNPVAPGQGVAAPENDADSDQISTLGVQKRVHAQRRLDPDQILNLVAEYVQGQTVAQLSRSWKIHRTTVMDHLERNDIPRRPHRRKMTDTQVQQAAKRYRAGETLAKLGKYYSVDPQTVSRELKKIEVQIRRPGSETPVDVERLEPAEITQRRLIGRSR
jgi:hypothetical protein